MKLALFLAPCGPGAGRRGQPAKWASAHPRASQQDPGHVTKWRAPDAGAYNFCTYRTRRPASRRRSVFPAHRDAGGRCSHVAEVLDHAADVQRDGHPLRAGKSGGAGSREISEPARAAGHRPPPNRRSSGGSHSSSSATAHRSTRVSEVPTPHLRRRGLRRLALLHCPNRREEVPRDHVVKSLAQNGLVEVLRHRAKLAG